MAEANKKLIILLILGLFVHQQRVNGFIFTAITLISLAWTAYEVANEIHDTYNKVTTASTADIMEKMEELSESIDQWGTEIEEKIQQSMDTLITRLPLLGQISEDVDLFNGYIGRIDELYMDFKDYMEDPGSFTNTSLAALIETFTSRDGDDALATINNIKNLIIPEATQKYKKSLFLLLAQETREYGLDLCDTGASPQQRLVELFDLAVESEMRVLAMYNFGVSMRQYTTGEDMMKDVKRNHKKVVKRAWAYIKTLKATVSLAARQFRRCDQPGERRRYRRKTDYEFGGYILGYVSSEGILEVDREYKCTKECTTYPTPIRPDYNKCKGYDCDATDTACTGYLENCQSLQVPADICENPYWAGQRYQYLIDGNGLLMGDDSDGCPGEIITAEKELLKGRRCDVCRCTCVNNSTLKGAIRTINLREQVTDVANNMVVVGIKFYSELDMMGMRLMQGQLGPQAEIIADTIDWMEREDIRENRNTFMHRDYLLGDENLVEDVDFMNFNFEDRRINLDTISMTDNYVITGVRFRRNKEEEQRPIQLEVQGTRFDEETGDLDLESSTWFTPEDMPYSKKFSRKDRVEFKTPEKTRSPFSSRKTDINSKPYTYIDITHTSWIEDAAQTTIPILDGAELVCNPPSPLVGVGLYHKAQPGYGGLLTLVLEGIDIGPFIPEEDGNDDHNVE